MHKKCIITGIVLVILFLLVVVIVRLVPKSSVNSEYPSIELKGEDVVTINEGEKFVEPGYVAHDPVDGDITYKVDVKENVDVGKPGVYEIKYKITNSKGKSVSARRIVKVNAVVRHEYKSEYDNIDNKVTGWGLSYKTAGEVPDMNMSLDELRKYNAYAVGVQDRVLYLTFDEGTLDTYLDEIVEILDNNNVKATFFLCKNYIVNNPELLKRMVKSGHSIGNHTASHPSMPSLATSANFNKYLEELKSTEDAFFQATGEHMDKIYREPRGEYSLRSLTIARDLGYKTFFWSVAYKDWDDSYTREQALEKLFDRVHDGAIYLLHSTSKSNYLALDEFIKTMTTEGYRFDLVKNIP